MDHDALFKWLLKDPVILRSFFEEFLPEVASYTPLSAGQRLDFSPHPCFRPRWSWGEKGV